MFTPATIWRHMLRLKVFRAEEIVNGLKVPSGYRNFAKRAVHSFIAQQLKQGLLRVVVEKPVVFATKFATEEDLKRVFRYCSVCGKPFIPARFDYHVCSEECRQKLRQERTRQKRKEQGVGSIKRKWTEEELKAIGELLTRKAKPGEYEELARKLGRTKKAVLSKVEELRYRPKSKPESFSKNKKWTQEEVELLKELLTRKAKQGEYIELSEKLGRTIQAVKRKVKKLRKEKRRLS